LKDNNIHLFVSSVLFVFWYHSPNILDTPHICNISRLRVKLVKTAALSIHTTELKVITGSLIDVTGYM
jgi:hypothetical protein